MNYNFSIQNFTQDLGVSAGARNVITALQAVNGVSSVRKGAVVVGDARRELARLRVSEVYRARGLPGFPDVQTQRFVTMVVLGLQHTTAIGVRFYRPVEELVRESVETLCVHGFAVQWEDADPAVRPLLAELRVPHASTQTPAHRGRAKFQLQASCARTTQPEE